MNSQPIDNGRTHEPSLRELTSDLNGLRQIMDAKIAGVSSTMDERDRRYEDRFTAMDEKTSLALTASEKAVVKAETATEKRFDAVNEFRGTLSDQAMNLMPRGESNAKFEALEKEISQLKERLDKGAGNTEGSRAVKDEGRANVGMLVGLIALAATLAAFVARWMK